MLAIRLVISFCYVINIYLDKNARLLYINKIECQYLACKLSGYYCKGFGAKE